ncbi:hypothetical protein CPB85DRAFT_1333897 [Mucidula mucida]|nr:hypothetical protein CPB85DRAFT_1333897 [Mucidula mucida]
MAQTYMTTLPVASGEKQLKVEDVQEAYLEHKDRLVNAIDETKSILDNIRTFNKDEWVVRYPQLRENDAAAPEKTRRGMRRSLSFADDPTTETDVLVSTERQGLSRSITLASISDAAEDTEEPEEQKEEGERLLPSSDFQVLRLDLKLGATGSSASASSLVSQLEKASIANLLDERITAALKHIDKLRARVEDTSSKVLVTGDLNAGNPPLSMPSSQPCTTAFCEVHDAAENNGVEEVHVIADGVTYNMNDELGGYVGENENNDKMLKLYLADSRAPQKFLWNASNEKAYLFIVVNKYDQIKNKDKCRRLVLEQIKQLSPRTYEDAEDLVHFVDSALPFSPSPQPLFDDLESSLRSFVLVKRSKSKLHPASTYLVNLLSDVDLLAGANALVADAEIRQAKEEIERAKPVLEKMQSNREALEESLEIVEETGANATASKTRNVLTDALERVGQGKLGVDDMAMPSYPGLLGIWSYARDVKKALLTSLDMAVKVAEDEARVVTSNSVDQIKNLAEEHLPAGVERNRRVFMPEAMFSAVRKNGKGHKGRRSSVSGAIVAGGVHGLGIGLAQRTDMLETTFLDLFDIHHAMYVHLGDGKSDEEASTPTALGLISVGVGALTMVGGQAVGARGIIEGIIRVTDLLGNETAKKWAAPVLGAFTIGLTAYLVLELPNSIPKTVGRRVKASVIRSDGEEEDTFIDIHAGRISRETRKVLRLASWDLRGRFTNAMEERGKEVRSAEETEKRAVRAKEWFTDVSKKTAEVRVTAELGKDL